MSEYYMYSACELVIFFTGNTKTYWISGTSPEHAYCSMITYLEKKKGLLSREVWRRQKILFSPFLSFFIHTHTPVESPWFFLVVQVSNNSLLWLLILIIKLSQICPWGAPWVVSCDPWRCPTILWILPYLFFAQDVLGSSCTFPSPALELAIFPRSSVPLVENAI